MVTKRKKLNRDEVVKALKAVALYFGRGKTAEELAEEFGVPEKRVKMWVTKLRKYGVDIPKVPQKNSFLRAIDELRVEKPDILKKQ